MIGLPGQFKEVEAQMKKAGSFLADNQAEWCTPDLLVRPTCCPTCCPAALLALPALWFGSALACRPVVAAAARPTHRSLPRMFTTGLAEVATDSCSQH